MVQSGRLQQLSAKKRRIAVEERQNVKMEAIYRSHIQEAFPAQAPELRRRASHQSRARVLGYQGCNYDRHGIVR